MKLTPITPIHDQSRATIGATLKRNRKQAGLSLAQLAEMAGCHRKTLRRIETGQTMAQRSMLERLDTALESVMKKRKQLAIELGREIVSVMSSDDRTGFDRKAWREGVANNIVASDEEYWDCDEDDVLDAMEEAIRES